MKVIKQGIPKSERIKYHGTCKDCECEVADVKQSETKLNLCDRADPRESDWRGVNCPQSGCRREIYLTETKGE